MRAVLVPLLIAASALGTACGSLQETVPEPAAPVFPDDWTVVDLTRPLGRDTPVLPHPHGFPFERIPLEGESAGRVTGAWSATDLLGTHVETPAVFGSGDARTDRIPLGHLALTTVVIEAPPRIELGPGKLAPAEVGLSAIYAHEARHGTIPRGALVLLRTEALPSPDLAGQAGWGADVVRFLARERRVRAIGSDAQTIDCGENVAESPAAREAARVGLLTVQGLTNLALLPPKGAVVVLGVVPVTGAPAAPARVLALVPPATHSAAARTTRR